MTTLNIGQAHQYNKRLEAEENEKDNPYWRLLDLDLKNATVRPIDLTEAKYLIEKYEYLGCVAAVNWYQFGLFFKDLSGKEVIGGAVIFGPEYAENSGVYDKYGYTGKLILLSRGVCLHWCPKNSNSFLVMNAINQLPDKYEVVTATADPDAGEIGTIYQACNWSYVGQMRKNKTRKNFVIKTKDNPEGKKFGTRAIRSKYGSMIYEKVLEGAKNEHGDNFINVEVINVHAKHRYFWFRGGKKTKFKNKRAIENLIKPYPKRKN